ncbi:hypothetical protein MCUN1_000812 [Malassezia cuniculi]|uniref:Cytochrome b-c1 complex subunit 10 n=1 Tax=Malassezia cuniculi TaxID=948313 RepID=A0AAF0ES18_9BASI|nr:hypothetical protein MCUN1_000812 [Malassezia cuniculi]
MSAFRASSIRLAGAFRPTARASFVKGVPQAHVGSITSQYAFKWVPSLFYWGGAGAVLVTVLLSGVPIFRADVLNKTPLAAFYEDKTPDSDKPF